MRNEHEFCTALARRCQNDESVADGRRSGQSLRWFEPQDEESCHLPPSPFLPSPKWKTTYRAACRRRSVLLLGRCPSAYTKSRAAVALQVRGRIHDKISLSPGPVRSHSCPAVWHRSPRSRCSPPSV